MNGMQPEVRKNDAMGRGNVDFFERDVLTLRDHRQSRCVHVTVGVLAKARPFRNVCGVSPFWWGDNEAFAAFQHAVDGGTVVLVQHG